MKNNGFRKITNIVVLVAICFCVMSCDLNANGKSENNTGSGTAEPKILTGACGETKDTSDDIIEINGQKYYTKKSNYEKDYYSENLYTIDPIEVKTPYTEETKDLFHEIRVKYWRKWLEDGVWQEIDTPNIKVYIKEDVVKSVYNDGDVVERKLESLKDKTSSFVKSEQGQLEIRNQFYTVNPKEIYTLLNHTYKNINL